MNKKKIIIAVGGTGGHIYPAVAVAEELCKRSSDLDIKFIGGGLNENPYIKGTVFPFENIHCGTLTLKKPISALINGFKLTRGILQSFKVMQTEKPDLVLGFGSYHSLPVLLAAKLAGMPYVLHEQNSILGRVNRLLSKKAQFTGYFFPSIDKQVKGLAIDVGMPLRQKYSKGNAARDEARNYFGLDTEKPVILIFGGSQGAKKLNQEFSQNIALLSDKKFAVIHLTGSQKVTEELKEHYKRQGILACVKDFEQKMDLAWQAADLLIARSGAGTIAEQLEFEVPGILVPYPYAKDNHQEFNADFMTHTVKGAIKIAEADFAKRNIALEARDLLFGDQLLTMKENMKQYKCNYKKQDFCSLILKFLNGKN